MTPPPKPKKRRVYRWICQYCNLEFETTNYNQRYCSKTHKKYAQRERKRERDSRPKSRESVPS